MTESTSSEADQKAVEATISILQQALGSGESANSARADLGIKRYTERGRPPVFINSHIQKGFEVLLDGVRQHLGPDALDRYNQLEQRAAWASGTMFEARDLLGITQPLLHQIGEICSGFKDIAQKELLGTLLDFEKSLLAEGKKGSTLERLTKAWLDYFYSDSK